MPTTGREPFYHALPTALAEQANGAGDALAVAEATVALWQQMEARLVPLIGVGGVEALLSRALHLSGRRFPWLNAASGEGEALLVLKVRLASQAPDLAIAAGHAVLMGFTTLLADLIGVSLTERLLAPLWSSAPSAAEQEKASWATK